MVVSRVLSWKRISSGGVPHGPGIGPLRLIAYIYYLATFALVLRSLLMMLNCTLIITHDDADSFQSDLN